MNFIFGIATVLFVIICIVLIFLVLIQNDKGGGLAGSIGGGLASAGSMLGTQDTANILTRGTTIFASAFMVLCIVLSLVLTRATRDTQVSDLKKRAEKQEQYSPSSVLGGGGLPMQGAPAPAAPAVPSAPVPAK